MDQGSGNPFQHINALYWSVSPVALRGIADRVRTILTELVAEMRAGMPGDQLIPTAELADQAVNVAVHGNKSRVTVTAAQSSVGSTSAASHGEKPGSPLWTRSRKNGAFAAGSASVLGLGFAIAQWQGWI